MLIPLDKLNGKLFTEQLHTQFKVHNVGAEPILLELVEVAEQDPSPRLEFFSIHFRGPVSPLLKQQIHRLEHAKLGTFEIFLTAISADPQGTVYEAIFHRFRQPQP